MAIQFGTSSWRAVIADGFTFAGVRQVTEAVCTHFGTNCWLGMMNSPGNWTGGVARSVATSHLVDRGAETRGLPVYETPVGCKFIGESINEDKIILGAEESAGLSINGHYPEKDGILACLLAAEAVAARGESLTQQLIKLYKRVGRLEAGRIGVRLTDELMKLLSGKLNQDPKKIGGRPIPRTNRMDGVKFIFGDGSWLLMRPSGNRATCSHLRGIRISNGLGGAS